MFVPQTSKKNKAQATKSSNDVPKDLQKFQLLPLHQKISQRAYQIYQNGGSADGRDQHDWFKAERELNAPRK